MKKIRWFTLMCMALNVVANVVLRASTWESAPSLMAVTLIPSLIVPIGVSLYLFCGDAFGNGKNGVFSALMGWQLLMAMRGFWSAVRTALSVPALQTWMIVAVDALILGGTVLLFVGSLRNFRYGTLYKIGAFLNACITALYLVLSFVGALAVSYFESVPDEASPVNWLAVAQFVTTVLFYVGLGVLGGKKGEENG